MPYLGIHSPYRSNNPLSYHSWNRRRSNLELELELELEVEPEAQVQIKVEVELELEPKLLLNRAWIRALSRISYPPKTKSKRAILNLIRARIGLRPDQSFIISHVVHIHSTIYNHGIQRSYQ